MNKIFNGISIHIHKFGCYIRFFFFFLNGAYRKFVFFGNILILKIVTNIKINYYNNF